MNPIVIKVYVHERVAIVAIAHIEAAHHQPDDAVGLILAPTVPMTILVSNDRIFRQYTSIFIIVVKVSKQRIMVHAQHLHAWLHHLAERFVEPREVFLLDVPIAHLHEWAAVHAYHHQFAHSEHKAVIAPQVVERLAGTLAPVVLVVARNDI